MPPMTVPSEQTPLLKPPPPIQVVHIDTANDHAEVYNRFTKRQKRILVGLVSWCGIMPLFVSGSFYPSVPQIAADFDTTPAVVSLAVSLSMFATALGGLCAASYSGFYGRKPVYLLGQILFCVGSLGVAAATSIPELMIWRFLQAFGASPGASVGAGVVGDIYRLEERGAAMGIFLSATFLGPVLAPPVGGLTAYYASWRVMQLLLGACGFVGLMGISLFFVETSHPGARGIDRWRLDLIKARDDGLGASGGGDKAPVRSRRYPPFVNPLSPLGLLRSPNLLAVSFAGFCAVLTDYVILVPLAQNVGKYYHITSEAIIGACFLPLGLGHTVAAPYIGRLSDKIIVNRRKKRGGVWYPEDRLTLALFAAGTFVPLSVLIAGLSMEYIKGPIGLVLTLFCLFWNGVGVQMTLGMSSAYLVDILHSKSAQSVAAFSGFRSLLISIAIAGIFPLLEKVGVVVTYGLSAMVAWLGFGIIWCVVKYGEQMRGWVDLEYSTTETN